MKKKEKKEKKVREGVWRNKKWDYLQVRINEAADRIQL